MIIFDLLNMPEVDKDRLHNKENKTAMILAAKLGLYEICELYCKKGVGLNGVRFI